ncbi:phage gp6-like head-tail connector protein [Oceanobacillus kimchii]|uniref:phage gp6-like head-tail connector protein n=1 Tax=Oceanobacillus kimchii TaxID=746691 RepID=UPI003C778819
MHISHNIEDSSLKELLSFSYASIKSSCGVFDLEGETDIDIRGKELVMERSRYAYNDAVEFFEDNFLSDITSLGIDIAYKEDGDSIEEV